MEENAMNQQLIRQARAADISRFLVEHHFNDIKVSGASICLRDKPYVCTKMGYCGYVDYHTNETGNAVDLLVRYLNYSFRDAVQMLTDNPVSAAGCQLSPQPAKPSVQNNFVIPSPANKPYTQVVKYLCSRSIPKETVQWLIDEELLFQDAVHGNAVFLSRARDFCEIRGTISTGSGKGFHGIRRRFPSCFWSIRVSSEPVQIAYICESSIDAISLYLLRKQNALEEHAAYVSIGGVANQQTIDRICRSVRTILAVDNDEAGQKCRERNASLEAILPVRKDWNEDLVAVLHKNGAGNSSRNTQNSPFMS